MISDHVLADMRVAMNESLPDTAVVYKATRTKDGGGGFIPAWVPGEPFPCRISPMAGGVGSTSAEALIVGRLGTAEGWVLTVPAGTDIDPPDRVTVNGTRGLEVAVVLAPRSWEISRRVVCVEMQ